MKHSLDATWYILLKYHSPKIVHRFRLRKVKNKKRADHILEGLPYKYLKRRLFFNNDVSLDKLPLMNRGNKIVFSLLHVV